VVSQTHNYFNVYVITKGYATDAADAAVQDNIVNAGYGR
jgi:hypothetical protein